jgi:tRNA(Ile)-lysidine synthase
MATAEALVDRVTRTIVSRRLFDGGTHLLVGVSGGADSVALLCVLKILQPTWKLTLHVAHLDHALRDGSADDAVFVKELADRWRVPATVEQRNVRQLCAQYGWSLEDGARRVRYQFLAEVAQRQQADGIALAHTADDQAETVLMRLLRGAGLTGLSAIPIKRRMGEQWMIRPLLETWRRDLEAFLQQQQLAWRQDSSNADGRFVRNRIRHELLPLLERDYNPNIKMALTQLAEQSQGDAAYLEEATRRQWRRVVRSAAAKQLAISVSAFLRQPKALQRQVVRRALQDLRGDLKGFEYRHWLETERLFLARPEGTLLDLPGGVQLQREKDRVICRRLEPI